MHAECRASKPFAIYCMQIQRHKALQQAHNVHTAGLWQGQTLETVCTCPFPRRQYKNRKGKTHYNCHPANQASIRPLACWGQVHRYNPSTEMCEPWCHCCQAAALFVKANWGHHQVHQLFWLDYHNQSVGHMPDDNLIRKGKVCFETLGMQM